jgi:hypothetical protein
MDWCRTAFIAGICMVLAVMSAWPAVSQAAPVDRPYVRASVSSGPVTRKESKPYFIEFRARAAQSYGHTFVVHGRIGQKITGNQVVGLHPATESAVPWVVGHVLLVPSETGASEGDTDEQYILARYRVLLTEAEYKRVVAYMKSLQASSPVWHAVLYNCNAFVADIAKFMGLKTPSTTLSMPKEFITELKGLNTGAAEAKPLAATLVQ